jgi:hypothetical protein
LLKDMESDVVWLMDTEKSSIGVVWPMDTEKSSISWLTLWQCDNLLEYTMPIKINHYQLGRDNFTLRA